MDREITAYLSDPNAEIRYGLLPERLRAVVGSEVEWQKALRAHRVSVQEGWRSQEHSRGASLLCSVLHSLVPPKDTILACKFDNYKKFDKNDRIRERLGDGWRAWEGSSSWWTSTTVSKGRLPTRSRSRGLLLSNLCL